MTKYPLETRVGIVGGGQLGKMMIQAAKRMGFFTAILDPTVNCPCHALADVHIVAAFDDAEGFSRLAEVSDVITYEFEHIDAGLLKAIEDSGKPVYPTPKSLEVIQDKFRQKQALANAGVPVPEFLPIYNYAELEEAAQAFGYPLMLKTRRGGYDGKGNALVRSADKLEETYNELGGGRVELYAEKYVKFVKEVSILACRAINGESKVFPLAENVHAENILMETRVPAEVSTETARAADECAVSVLDVFQGVGMFCVELFVTADGGVLVNEVAPRPHNSGHYTIEACVTSQFEQHIRAITGLPLGSAELITPVCMVNILGSAGERGKARYEGVTETLSLPNTYLHIYGKTTTAPKRKMGHVTVTAKTAAEVAETARKAQGFIKVVAKGEHDE